MTRRRPASAPSTRSTVSAADLPRPGAVVVGEPTLMEVADAHKSITAFSTRVFGRGAHSSNPYAGRERNRGRGGADRRTLSLFADELLAQGDPSGRFNPAASTVSVGVVEGGTARNILAERCAFQWEFRGLPDAPRDAALRRLEAYADNVVLPRMRAFAPESHTLRRPSITRCRALRRSQARARRRWRCASRDQTGPWPSPTRLRLAASKLAACPPSSAVQAISPRRISPTSSFATSQLEACLAFLDRLPAAL